MSLRLCCKFHITSVSPKLVGTRKAEYKYYSSPRYSNGNHVFAHADAGIITYLPYMFTTIANSAVFFLCTCNTSTKSQLHNGHKTPSYLLSSIRPGFAKKSIELKAYSFLFLLLLWAGISKKYLNEQLTLNKGD